jgi:hypothetical protein
LLHHQQVDYDIVILIDDQRQLQDGRQMILVRDMQQQHVVHQKALRQKVQGVRHHPLILPTRYSDIPRVNAYVSCKTASHQ